MFDNLQKQIESLETKGTQLVADWDREGSNALLAFYIRIMPKALNAERCHLAIVGRVIWAGLQHGIS